MLSILGRAPVSKVTAPLGRALNATGLTPNSVTLIGTVVTVVAAITMFPAGYLFWGTMVITLFVLFDMLDGAMARARGGGTKYGAVLDATCDRVADGAIFAGLAWWAVFSENDKVLFVATLVCLVTSQVISYAKARAEASGLSADGGWIERPDRLVIVLVAAGLTGIGRHFDIPGLQSVLYPAMWVLAALSVVTVFQRVLAVRGSDGARDIITPPSSDATGKTESA
ncbi:CDP-alcohol phosphatidyltransferase family protein [Rhodococcus sp. BP-252]|uniref:phosphatidylinositol phosphate synthase n=1 Tax=unclassified Rhodococcus (in: high G+C Gram-positive bacteria) TaxID=192944 RepID=UPI000DF267FF|nr:MULTISPECIES: CDP-alcohol phosphatidyltransferase family protein [unclassified Rhodococcus (in: high G+C Gram-positive bacteria)]MBY6414489.1 CDP-alcohol phosphatidyltransferase family protein [Rhodococcus sp. BP-320]MBY6419201.1 CDP-alcohol phosphatidyltransferase family protein [Rhodococcus sp. BP-321]MBY6423956.1 CDP-alcohol phosphatidyltransferase family protein [Rhodococcus sp. BP-324]MBY6429338.1 CDP-alcohol phosphatidyltransferase family protein [Rhodococcus sp. BP-323]MBY6434299.1 C